MYKNVLHTTKNSKKNRSNKLNIPLKNDVVVGSEKTYIKKIFIFYNGNISTYVFLTVFIVLLLFSLVLIKWQVLQYMDYKISVSERSKSSISRSIFKENQFLVDIFSFNQYILVLQPACQSFCKFYYNFLVLHGITNVQF